MSCTVQSSALKQAGRAVRGTGPSRCLASSVAMPVCNRKSKFQGTPVLCRPQKVTLRQTKRVNHKKTRKSQRPGYQPPGTANTTRREVTEMCGILGIFKQPDAGSVAEEIYEGLLMLQHRGQDSAGIVTFDGERFREKKDNGLVKDVFQKKDMERLTGSTGIGHVRYPTAGSSSAQEAQPFFVNSPLGIYLIHNGNLTNTDELRAKIGGSGLDDTSYARHLRTESDSEVLLNIFADEVYKCTTRKKYEDISEVLFDAAAEVMKCCRGSYSVICIIDQVGLFAFRDPHGIRPLVMGKRTSVSGNDWCFASEDCAFGPIGFQRIDDVAPGQAVLITEKGTTHSRQCVPGELNPCIFEYIYLARPDSILNNISVYDMQLSLGRKLAQRIKSEGIVDQIDLVVPVPDGSRPAAIEIASELGKPYREGLVKNRYVGRTFIMPNQRLRELSVKRKLNAMRSVFEGKSILLVDDSIVRGTTMTQIVKMVKAAGATKVFLASAAPPVKYPNVYGVDMPSKKEFIANNLTEAEVCEVLGADGLIYQTLDDLLEAGKHMNPTIETFDTSCFTGNYVTGDIDQDYLDALEGAGRGAKRAGIKVSSSSSSSSPSPAELLKSSQAKKSSQDAAAEEKAASAAVKLKSHSTLSSEAAPGADPGAANGGEASKKKKPIKK